MYVAYTPPVPGATSMIGSNWPDPLHAQSGLDVHVAPPFELIWSEMYGDGQFPLHGLPA
jgi:hypothetical protein